MPRMHVVFGKYDGPIDAKPGEKVVFIGDCASWKGEIAGKPVAIESLYKDRATKDPHDAKHDDIYAKMLSVTKIVAEAARTKSPIRLEGCPVSVTEQVLALVAVSDVDNPMLDATSALRFNRAYLGWRGTTMAKRLAGKPYQIHGDTPRGAGAPQVEAPPAHPAAEE